MTGTARKKAGTSKAGAGRSTVRPARPSPVPGASDSLITATVLVGAIDPIVAAELLGVAKAQLAGMVGLPLDALYRQDRVKAVKTQNRLREFIEILMRVEPWAGGRLQALAWYRGQGISAFGDQTAEAMVKAGHADAVRSYLDGLAVGGYA